MLRPIIIALQFLTRLPLPGAILKETDYQPRQLGQSVLFYPLAGLLIGALLVLLSYLLQQFLPQLSSMVIAAVVLFCWVILTGALHLDGLSDSADAWVGGYGDRDKTLAIMKDPYCGPAGVVIIVIVLLAKFAVLTSVIQGSWLVLLASPVLARACILFLFLTTPYVRKQGIGAVQAQQMPRMMAWTVLLLLCMVCVYLFHVKALWLLGMVVAVFLFLRYLMVQRLGGTTGDTAGAMVEVMEVVVLLSLI